MFRTRTIVSVLAAAAVLAACGSNDNGGGTTSQATTTQAAATTAEETTTSSTAPAGLEQPALWPAANVTFSAPQDAAADFVQQVLGVTPVLGEFRQGDSRSGEIDVLSPGEGGGIAVPRGTLILRQLGPNDAWFVIGAGSDVQSIATPATLAVVPAGPLTVTGQAMGFEATSIVEAFVAGVAAPLAKEVVMAGTMGTAGPFTVTLDLSKAAPGAMVGIVVQGTTGLETDPGDFTAIVVTIAG